MQPYLFPYIGYFQLMQAVDKFIVLDDVTYIQQGWINRNRILVNHRAHLFTVPLKKAGHNELIKDLEIAKQQDWQGKLLKKITLAYKKAPFFDVVFPVLERIILYPSRVLVDYIGHSLFHLHRHLGLTTELVGTSRRYHNRNLNGQERILDICRQESGDEYINAIGGTALYSAARFASVDIALRFLQPRMIQYRQFGKDFIPWLSIIDVLMFNGPEQAANYLTEYELIAGEAA